MSVCRSFTNRASASSDRRSWRIDSSFVLFPAPGPVLAFQAPLQVRGARRQLVVRVHVLPLVAGIINPHVLADADLAAVLALAIRALLILDDNYLGDLVHGHAGLPGVQPVHDRLRRLLLGEVLHPVLLLGGRDLLQPAVDLLDLLAGEPVGGGDQGQERLQVLVHLLVIRYFPHFIHDALQGFEKPVRVDLRLVRGLLPARRDRVDERDHVVWIRGLVRDRHCTGAGRGLRWT
mmetsp:Transcript_97465/g.297853  ORF Transcript_97465/g.297853 Transcript_97465/m.297853 type:complete len:234 (+) Transcript_97465:125-826(+)